MTASANLLLPTPAKRSAVQANVARPLGQQLLRSRVAHGAEESPSWPRCPVACVSRALLQVPLFAALDLLAPVRVFGLRELAAVEGPVLLAANHTSHIDTAALLKALPPERRGRVAVAAASDYFFARPWVGAAVALAFNAFPFERASCSQVRTALARCHALVDEGWSVLLYPEGTRSLTGSMAPFKPGLGLLAVELKVPVVPVYLDGPFSILPKGKCLPRKGSITVSFGKPLTFSGACRFRDAAQVIDEAVRSLGAEPMDMDAKIQAYPAVHHGRSPEE